MYHAMGQERGFEGGQFVIGSEVSHAEVTSLVEHLADLFYEGIEVAVAVTALYVEDEVSLDSVEHLDLV